jgi:hypothetical protein
MSNYVIEFPTVEFNFNELRTLVDSEAFDRNGKPLETNPSWVKYINKYFFATYDGDVLFWDDNSNDLVVYNENKFRFVFLNRFPNVAQTYFLSQSPVYVSAKIENLWQLDKEKRVVVVEVEPEPEQQQQEKEVETEVSSEIALSNVLDIVEQVAQGKIKTSDVKSVSVKNKKNKNPIKKRSSLLLDDEADFVD